MGSYSSIYIGMSGLNANSQWLNSVGGNIANMNTVAFKASRPVFADLVRGSLAGGGRGADGMGVAVTGLQLNFSQGPLSQSNNPMDWAIDGNGFFTVQDADGNSLYTRAGQFRLQAGEDDYQVVTNGGHVLQGYTADDEGTIGDTLGDVTLAAVMNAKATTTAAMTLNLDASAEIRSGTFDETDASTYNFSASETIYDARTDEEDVAHTLTAYFVKTDDNTWDVHVQVDGGTVSSAGQLVFDTSGELSSGAEQTVSLTVPLGGTPPASLTQSLDLDFTGTTQYGAHSGILAQSQDGYNQGRLETVSLGDDGIITGNFSNEQHQRVAQVALASFENPLGLTPSGESLFAESEESGAAETVKPGSVWASGEPSVGEVRAGMLELSNVELTDNFVDMMAAQFGFQGSSRAITSTDEILQVVLNLKR